MSLFKCSECGCVENTATSDFWLKFAKKDKRPLCSKCDPDIGVWHGRFPQRPAKGMLVSVRNFLYCEPPGHDRIIGTLEGDPPYVINKKNKKGLPDDKSQKEED